MPRSAAAEGILKRLIYRREPFKDASAAVVLGILKRRRKKVASLSGQYVSLLPFKDASTAVVLGILKRRRHP